MVHVIIDSGIGDVSRELMMSVLCTPPGCSTHSSYTPCSRYRYHFIGDVQILTQAFSISQKVFATEYAQSLEVTREKLITLILSQVLSHYLFAGSWNNGQLVGSSPSIASLSEPIISGSQYFPDISKSITPRQCTEAQGVPGPVDLMPVDTRFYPNVPSGNPTKTGGPME